MRFLPLTVALFGAVAAGPAVASSCLYDRSAKAMVISPEINDGLPDANRPRRFGAEPTVVAGKRYEPYGLERALSPGDFMQFRLVAEVNGAPIFRHGESDEVLYVFVDAAVCAFQPLRVEIQRGRAVANDQVRNAVRNLLNEDKTPIAPPPAPVAARPAPPVAANDPSVELNRAILERDQAIAARNAANAEEARAANARYQAALAQRQADIARQTAAAQAAAADHAAKMKAYDAEVARLAAETAARQRQYQAERAAWEQRVRECQAGKVASCGT